MLFVKWQIETAPAPQGLDPFLIDLLAQSDFSIHVRLTVTVVLFSELPFQITQPSNIFGTLSEEIPEDKMPLQRFTILVTNVGMVGGQRSLKATIRQIKGISSGNAQVAFMEISDFCKPILRTLEILWLNDNVNVNDWLGGHSGDRCATDMLDAAIPSGQNTESNRCRNSSNHEGQVGS